MRIRKYFTLFILMSTLVCIFAVSAAAKTPTSAIVGVVNINTANLDQLALLPGVGISKAKAIVDYRSKKPFSSATELMNVKGIGEKLFSKVKKQVVVRGNTTAKKPAKKVKK